MGSPERTADGHDRAPAPAPPGRGSTTRWIVGIASVVVLGVGAVLTALALGGNGGTEEAAEGDLGQGEFVPVGSLCRDVDLSPVFDIAQIAPAAPASRERETASSHWTTCIFGEATSGSGVLEAEALVGRTPEDASRFYRGFLEQSVGPRALPAHVAGRWDEGVVRGGTHPMAEAGLIVLDDVLVLRFHLATPATGATASELEDLQSALLEAADRMRDVMRRPD